jgi:peptide deformylase
LYTLVNPEIRTASEEVVAAPEACLSIPGFAGDVERFEAIQVRGLNRFGKPMRLKLEGWMARIFQHEIDHLDGVLFIDRALKVWKLEEADEPISAAD